MASLSEHAPQVESDEGYPAKWRQYARRQNLAFFLLFGWVPACVALFWASRNEFHMPVLALSLMVVWLLAALGAVYWAGEFRCPRCRRRFGALGNKKTHNVTRGLFDKVCNNCRLRKFEL